MIRFTYKGGQIRSLLSLLSYFGKGEMRERALGIKIPPTNLQPGFERSGYSVREQAGGQPGRARRAGSVNGTAWSVAAGGTTLILDRRRDRIHWPLRVHSAPPGRIQLDHTPPGGTSASGVW